MKNYFLLLLLSCTWLCAIGQSTPDQKLVTIPPSPEASSLFKFVETPVSEFTGVPDISIPIYNIQLGKFSFPISLKYHSAGNKVAEQSSNVGLGWALEAGGQITSTVMGKPDFSSLGYFHFGHLLPTTAPMNPMAWYSYPGLEWWENADYTLAKQLMGNPVIPSTGGPFPLSSSIYDTQPDVFFYSMFGRAGKFFFSNGQAHTIPFSNIKIDNDFKLPMSKGHYTFMAHLIRQM
jgi:hypothetical protein